jgi:hypothetical protein
LRRWQCFERERHLPFLDAEALDHTRQVTNRNLLGLVFTRRQHLQSKNYEQAGYEVLLLILVWEVHVAAACMLVPMQQTAS